MDNNLAELEYRIGELNKNFHRLIDLSHLNHRQFSEFDRSLREVSELIKRLKNDGGEVK